MMRRQLMLIGIRECSGVGSSSEGGKLGVAVHRLFAGGIKVQFVEWG